MIALLSTVLVASVAGSLHCVAMCGPLIGLAGGARTVRLALVHAVGRLATYLVLGIVAGALGGALDLAAQLGDVQRVATVVAAATIFAWAAYIGTAGLRARRRVAGGAAPLGLRRGVATRAFQRGVVQLRRRRPATRAYLVGVLTGLLPCGWLWAFVVSAAGTGSPVLGAAVMFAFWLGTVPAMTGVLALGGGVFDTLRRRLPLVTAVALIVLGVGTLALRWPGAASTDSATPSCHAEHAR